MKGVNVPNFHELNLSSAASLCRMMDELKKDALAPVSSEVCVFLGGAVTDSLACWPASGVLPPASRLVPVSCGESKDASVFPGEWKDRYDSMMAISWCFY